MLQAVAHFVEQATQLKDVKLKGLRILWLHLTGKRRSEAQLVLFGWKQLGQLNFSHLPRLCLMMCLMGLHFHACPESGFI